MTRLGSIALIAITGFAWGMIAPASKALFAAAPGSFDGITLAVARGACSLPLLLLICITKWRSERPRVDTRVWLLVVAGGVFIGPLNTLVYSVAAAHNSLAHIAFLVGAAPMVNAAAAALVFRTPLGTRNAVALALGLCGVFVIASTHTAGESSLAGDALMLVWLVGFAGYACCVRAIGARMSSLLLSSLVMSVAMGIAAIPALFGVGASAIAHVAATPAIGLAFWGELIAFATITAPITYAAAIRRRGVAVATIGAEYTSIAVGVAASLVAHEAWTVQTGIGGALLAAALAATFAPVGRLRAGFSPRAS